jgi:isoleucyl-tRNA synthetase
MAFWVDLKTAYVTFHNEYIESLWWIMKQFWDKGLLFQGYKIVPYCPRCGTPLSSHELSLGYKEGTIDPSVFVKFRVKNGSRQRAQPGARRATTSTCWPGRPRRGRCRAMWRWPWARTCDYVRVRDASGDVLTLAADLAERVLRPATKCWTA